MWDGFGRWLGNNWKPYLRARGGYKDTKACKIKFEINRKPVKLDRNATNTAIELIVLGVIRIGQNVF